METTYINITGDNNEYLVAHFRETPASEYRIMVFDKEGKTVFKTSDSGNNVVIEGKVLYFYDYEAETLCKVDL